MVLALWLNYLRKVLSKRLERFSVHEVEAVIYIYHVQNDMSRYFFSTKSNIAENRLLP